MTERSTLHELKIKEEDLEIKRRQTIEQCIEACKRAQFNYKGGAPDYQGGAEACIEELKALLVHVPQPRDCVPGIGPHPLPKPAPPAARLWCEACGPLPADGKHTSWLCRFAIWLHGK